MKSNMQKGMSRLFALAGAIWMVGSSWYIFQYEPKQQKEGFSISLNDETRIDVDASGLRRTDRQDEKIQKLAVVILPAVFFFLLIPAYGWLQAGFNGQGKKDD